MSEHQQDIMKPLSCDQATFRQPPAKTNFRINAKQFLPRASIRFPKFEVKSSLVSVLRFKGTFRSNLRSGSNALSRVHKRRLALIRILLVLAFDACVDDAWRVSGGTEESQSLVACAA